MADQPYNPKFLQAVHELIGAALLVWGRNSSTHPEFRRLYRAIQKVEENMPITKWADAEQPLAVQAEEDEDEKNKNKNEPLKGQMTVDEVIAEVEKEKEVG
jgi:hypothetical protein